MPSQPRRSDSRRNRALLITAAREAVASSGSSMTMEQIARSAGVGIGTLYRHFSSRDDVLVAIYADDVARLAASADSLLDDKDEGQALHIWMQDLVALLSARAGLASATLRSKSAAGGAADDAFGTEVMNTAARLLEDARRHQMVRPEVRAEDVVLLCNAIATACEASREAGARLLDYALEGIRPR